MSEPTRKELEKIRADIYKTFAPTLLGLGMTDSEIAERIDKAEKKAIEQWHRFNDE